MGRICPILDLEISAKPEKIGNENFNWTILTNLGIEGSKQYNPHAETPLNPANLILFAGYEVFLNLIRPNSDCCVMPTSPHAKFVEINRARFRSEQKRLNSKQKCCSSWNQSDCQGYFQPRQASIENIFLKSLASAWGTHIYEFEALNE